MATEPPELPPLPPDDLQVTPKPPPSPTPTPTPTPTPGG
jgi:hypothetical protein